MLSWSSSLQDHSDFPVSITGSYGSYTACTLLTACRSMHRHWDLRSNARILSPHATGLTPGPPQVLSPFPSLRTYPALLQVYPASGLSQLYLSRVTLRGCTIRFMLRPAVLAGIPDWVKPGSVRVQTQAVSTPCRGKFGPCVTTRTRPQPTYPKGQLI